MYEYEQLRYGILVMHNSMSATVLKNGKSLKKFKGETAWQDGIRWAQDFEYKLQMQEL